MAENGILELKAKAWDDLVTFYNEHDFANSSSPAADLDEKIEELIDDLDKSKRAMK